MKKLLFICMLCMLTLSVSAQKRTTARTRTNHKTTKVVERFNSVDEFFNWVEGKTFKGKDEYNETYVVYFKDHKAYANDHLEDFEWTIEKGEGSGFFEGFMSSVSVNKAKKTLTIQPRFSKPIVLKLVN